MIETGANDVLVVVGDRKHLIPFVRPDVVRGIDLELGRMEVDWDPEF
jgi:16S rRNA processing protein RimM